MGPEGVALTPFFSRGGVPAGLGGKGWRGGAHPILRRVTCDMCGKRRLGRSSGLEAAWGDATGLVAW